MIIVDTAALTGAAAEAAFRRKVHMHVDLYRNLSTHRAREPGVKMRDRFIKQFSLSRISVPSAIPHEVAAETVVEVMVDTAKTKLKWTARRFESELARTSAHSLACTRISRSSNRRLCRG